ncbi:hypothetical protein NEFER01_0739 [Nematocida sp. LUAm1]|nr:hypothetical protein NEFER01_0739 [Nematocida sp. LUAm1]
MDTLKKSTLIDNSAYSEKPICITLYGSDTKTHEETPPPVPPKLWGAGYGTIQRISTNTSNTPIVPVMSAPVDRTTSVMSAPVMSAPVVSAPIDYSAFVLKIPGMSAPVVTCGPSRDLSRDLSRGIPVDIPGHSLETGRQCNTCIQNGYTCMNKCGNIKKTANTGVEDAYSYIEPISMCGTCSTISRSNTQSPSEYVNSDMKDGSVRDGSVRDSSVMSGGSGISSRGRHGVVSNVGQYDIGIISDRSNGISSGEGGKYGGWCGWGLFIFLYCL